MNDQLEGGMEIGDLYRYTLIITGVGISIALLLMVIL